MKPLSTKTQFKEAVSYLSESKHYIFITIGIFILATIAGFVFEENLSFLDILLKEIIEKTQGLNTPEMTFFILQNNLQSAFISAILGIFLGVFPLFSGIANGLILGYVLAKTFAIAGISSWWRILPHGIFELPAIFISFGIGIKWGIGSIKNYFKTYEKEKNMKTKGTIILLVTLISMVIFLAMVAQGGTKNVNLLTTLPLFICLIGMAFFLTLFVLSINIKIRKFQKRIFYNSINTFLMIIIPLLIIAAIIEGILIGFLS